jgi:hypothetical protein
VRTTTTARHGDRTDQDGAHDAREHGYDNPRRRREHHDEREDDERQEQAAGRSARRIDD